MRVIFFSLILFISSSSFSFGDTLEGRLVSIDADERMLTLDGGETMKLTEPVPMEGLGIGQLLRLEYNSGTVDVTSVLILEEAPPTPLDEEPIEVEGSQ